MHIIYLVYHLNIFDLIKRSNRISVNNNKDIFWFELKYKLCALNFYYLDHLLLIVSKLLLIAFFFLYFLYINSLFSLFLLFFFFFLVKLCFFLFFLHFINSILCNPSKLKACQLFYHSPITFFLLGPSIKFFNIHNLGFHFCI